MEDRKRSGGNRGENGEEKEWEIGGGTEECVAGLENV